MASDQRERSRSNETPNSSPEDALSSQSEEMVVDPTTSSSNVATITTDQRNNMEKGFSGYVIKSSKINVGPPARYQLKTKRVNLDKLSDEDSKLRRFTLGKNPNKTVLLVGETGSGKSTLINALVNFVMGVKFEDKVWFEIIEEEKDNHISAVSVYEVFGIEGVTVPYSLTIIDTPGYGHTGGLEHDEMITHKLHDLFCVPGVVDTIDAVGLVIKASVNRLDERLAYIFNSVTSLFGKNMENNIVVIITHSDWIEPADTIQALKDAIIKCARNEENDLIYFLFNNSQKQPIIDVRGGESAAQYSFETSENSMKGFADFLENCQPQSLKTTEEVIKVRNKLNTCCQKLKEHDRDIKEKESEIKNNKDHLLKHQQEMEDNKNFAIQVEETYKEREKIVAWWDTKAVTCLKCEENCHHPGCTWAWSPSWCEVMKKGKCTSCSGKCPLEDHVKEKTRYVTKTRTVTKTNEEMKSKYKAEHDTMSTVLEKMKKEMADLQQNKKQCLDEAFNIIEQLESIALNVDSVSTYVHLKFLIEKMKENGDTQKVQKLERMRDRIDEKNKAGAMYLLRYFKKN